MKHQDELITLTEDEEDPGTLTGADFPVENEDLKRKARALREADAPGQSKLGSPAPIRNKVRTTQ